MYSNQTLKRKKRLLLAIQSIIKNNMKITLTIALILISHIAIGQKIEISSKNRDSKELDGKSQMERIIKNYEKEIKNWIFTNKINIDKNVIPFSHPVLTLNCNYLDNDLKQLATFLHEQFHWFVSSKIAEEENAIKAFKELFPEVPVEAGLGARNEYSTYLHLIVCDMEFQALTKLIGENSARQLLAKWTHYTWIYKTVLEHKQVREINIRYGFIIP